MPRLSQLFGERSTAKTRSSSNLRVNVSVVVGSIVSYSARNHAAGPLFLRPIRGYGLAVVSVSMLLGLGEEKLPKYIEFVRFSMIILHGRRRGRVPMDGHMRGSAYFASVSIYFLFLSFLQGYRLFLRPAFEPAANGPGQTRSARTGPADTHIAGESPGRFILVKGRYRDTDARITDVITILRHDIDRLHR